MTAKQANLMAQDEQLRKRLAKLTALQCFRNTELENLHAGRVHVSQTGDYTEAIIQLLQQGDMQPEWNKPFSTSNPE